MHWEEVWTGTTVGAAVTRTVLTPASWIYALGWQAYLAAYRLGIKRPQQPHAPVLCVGNLQVGGTGKTPTTVFLAGLLREMGLDVVVSCSGYGSAASEAARIAPEGTLKASEWGDEAALLRWLIPDLPLIVGRRRVLAAELCHREFRRSVLLMDDGFQHLPLKKSASIVLDPPVANRRCLPAGPYREPYGNRRRADLVIPNGYRLVEEPIGFLEPSGAGIDPKGPVDVLCALGRPNKFLSALGAKGLEMGRVELLPDHNRMADADLLRRFDGSRPVILTGKDWVKIRDRSDAATLRFVIATHGVRIEPRSELIEWLRSRTGIQ